MIKLVKRLYNRHISRSVTIENINSNRSIEQIRNAINGYRGKKKNLYLVAGISHTTLSRYLSGKTVLQRYHTKAAMCKLYTIIKSK